MPREPKGDVIGGGGGGRQIIKIWDNSARLNAILAPPLESRELRNIVLSKFCSEVDRKFDVRLIACVSGALDHIDCLKYHSCCLVSPVFVDCNILIHQKCPLMHQSELFMVIIELYFSKITIVQQKSVS